MCTVDNVMYTTRTRITDFPSAIDWVHDALMLTDLAQFLDEWVTLAGKSSNSALQWDTPRQHLPSQLNKRCCEVGTSPPSGLLRCYSAIHIASERSFEALQRPLSLRHLTARLALSHHDAPSHPRHPVCNHVHHIRPRRRHLITRWPLHPQTLLRSAPYPSR